MDFTKFMNAPEGSISGERAKVLFNNLLAQIVKTTPFDNEEQYEHWLITEIGMSNEEIESLKSENLFPCVR